MAGIERIKITNKVQGRGAYRFKKAKDRWLEAHRYYQFIFNELKCPLEDGVSLIEGDLNGIAGTYDKVLGIDIIFNFRNGQRATCQEKLLFEDHFTATVELYDDPNEGSEGDWFNCIANYYFVAYDTNENLTFNDWVFLDWASVQRASSQGRIEWQTKHNRYDGARANFKSVKFDKIPNDCIIARGWNNGQDHYINEHFLGY